MKPDAAEIHNNLGIALQAKGALSKAVDTFQRAIALKADFAEAHNNLGNALRTLRQLDKAVAVLHRAIALNPAYAEAHNNLGLALQWQNQIDQAIAAFQRALQIQPDYAEAHNNLGTAWKDYGKLDEAIAEYRRALEIDPRHAKAHSNLILTALYHPGWDEHAVREQCARWEQQHAWPLRKFIERHGNLPDPDRPLKVGYVSADFRDHVVGRNVLPLFEHHDRERFEVFCYSGVVPPDAMTERFRKLVAGWRETAGITDEGLARMIRIDGIDILVDLALHTGPNALFMFARKPAPVQVSFAGYPGRTGLSAIEYRDQRSLFGFGDGINSG